MFFNIIFLNSYSSSLVLLEKIAFNIEMQEKKICQNQNYN
jgi:hypothetical protein